MKTHSQQTIQSKLSSGPHRWAIISATIVLALSLIVLWQASQWYQATLLSNQRSQIENNLIPYENALTSILNQRFALLEGLVAFTKTSPTDADLRRGFTSFVSGIYTGKHDIRAIQIFPKEGAVLVYPIEGNEATIGRTLDDLINDDRPDVRADIQRTIQTRQIAISGPYELRQGGLGMVARLAIYQEDTLIGIAVVILDIPTLLESSGFANPQPHIRLALKDSSGQILTGSEHVFTDNPVIYTVVLPDGDWELAATPPDGWTASIRNSLRTFQYAGLLIIALALSLAYLITNSQARLTLAIQKRTASLDVSLAQLEQANETLRASEEQYRSLVELTPNGILIHLDGQIVFANPAAVRILGASAPENLVGKRILDIVHPDDQKPVVERIRQIVKDHQTVPLIEEKFVRLDGTVIDVEVTALPFTYSHQNAVQVVFRDITDRKRAEEELIESEEKFATIFKAAPGSMILSSLPDGKTIEVNENFSLITGYSKEEALGKTTADLKMWADTNARDRFLSILQSDGIVRGFEADLNHKSGAIRNGLLTGRIVTVRDRKYIISTFYDITDRKRAEEALRLSEQYNRMLFESSPIGLALCRMDGSLVDINPAYAQIIGRTVEETLSLTYWDVTPKAYAELEARQLQSLEATGRYGPFEKEYIHKDGQLVPVRLTGLLIERNGENFIWSSVEDLTERKRAEDDLQRNEQRLSSIYNTVGVIILHLAVEGEGQYRFLSVNPSFYRVTGLSQEQIIGKTVNEVIPEPSLGMVLARYRQAIETRAIVSWEEISDYPTGQLTGEVSITPVFDNEGRCTHLVGSFHDITERKLAEKEIRRRNEELAALNAIGRQINKTLSLDTVISAAGNDIVAVTQAEVAFLFLREGEKLTLAGITPKDAKNKFGDIPEHRVGECMCGLAVKEGKSLFSHNIYTDMRCTWEECKKAGYQSFAAIPLRSGEEIIGVVGLACQVERDFAPQAEFLETLASQVASGIANAKLYVELQKLNENLDQIVATRTAQLSVANQNLESFSYSVSHDLRAPLRAINGFASILANRHKADLNEEGQHYLDNVVQASERMGHLIDDLLNYSRLGRERVRHLPVSLSRVFTEIIQNLQSVLDDNHGVIEIAADIPGIISDQTLLEQIFSNLLDNAMTYHKPGVPPRVAVSWHFEGNHIIVKVSDNGIGIPKEYQGKIFNVFQRLHNEDQYPGTGIGLANVKKAVELLGGSVWVESKVGEGSKFFVQLPKEQAHG